ncbi:unnamed protein product [Amoebophrya sp. A120]|nr:unnamed protein product [Amoebophrya sp. A120]|eukprot:GSA120T00019759001.1
MEMASSFDRAAEGTNEKADLYFADRTNEKTPDAAASTLVTARPGGSASRLQARSCTTKTSFSGTRTRSRRKYNDASNIKNFLSGTAAADRRASASALSTTAVLDSTIPVMIPVSACKSPAFLVAGRSTSTSTSSCSKCTSRTSAQEMLSRMLQRLSPAKLSHRVAAAAAAPFVVDRKKSSSSASLDGRKETTVAASGAAPGTAAGAASGGGIVSQSHSSSSSFSASAIERQAERNRALALAWANRRKEASVVALQARQTTCFGYSERAVFGLNFAPQDRVNRGTVIMPSGILGAGAGATTKQKMKEEQLCTKSKPPLPDCFRRRGKLSPRGY